MLESNRKDETTATTMPIAIISLYGTEDLTKRISYYLKSIYRTGKCQIIDMKILRFSTGDAKAVLENTVRGADVYIIMDVGNYNCNYKMYGKEVAMSPDEHFQNLKRAISAIGGKANRINVVSPMLYSARQDRRISRESLDCAASLRELENINVKNIMAFDVHDDRVQNAVPFMGFDNLMPTYQVIKTMKKYYPDIIMSEDSMLVVSPDLGGTNRTLLYSNELELEMGIFYKRRSRNKLIGGKYPVEVHKYIGPEIEGKDILIVDDIIASGETILDVVKKVKKLGGKRVFIAATFGLFTEGIEQYDDAYSQGLFDAAFITNATYRSSSLIQAPWYKEVDISKYIAYYIYCVNAGKSISNILDPHKKIQDLLHKKNPNT